MNARTLDFLKARVPQFTKIVTQSTLSRAVNQNAASTRQSESKELRRWRNALESTSKPLINVSPDLAIFKLMRTDFEISPKGLAKYLKQRAIKSHRKLQDVNRMVQESLGADIALGYFIVYQGGKVKFKNHDKWIALGEDKKTADLPKHYHPDYIVSEVDASDIILHYNGLENFRNCKMIKRATFKRSLLFDDWFVDRISSYFPYLEYLDISDCPKVSERAMEALYKCSELKTLVITNYGDPTSFELTYLMLQDIIPELEIKVLEPTKLNEIDLYESFN